ncbi:hypothetical protein, partial [Mesorhizobium opportunistum]
MEIDAAREVRTTCPYCGVGCGVLAKVAPGRANWRPRGPPPTPQFGPESWKSLGFGPKKEPQGARG